MKDRIVWDFMGRVITKGCTVVFVHSKYQQMVEGKVISIAPKMCRIECTRGHESAPQDPSRLFMPHHKGTPKIATRAHGNLVVVSYPHEDDEIVV